MTENVHVVNPGRIPNPTVKVTLPKPLLAALHEAHSMAHLQARRLLDLIDFLDCWPTDKGPSDYEPLVSLDFEAGAIDYARSLQDLTWIIDDLLEVLADSIAPNLELPQHADIELDNS